MVPPLTRRELLKFAGGAGVGALLTPMPWKLIDDISIWTQNSDRIAKLPHGEITTRAAVCTLCPAGCRVVAHCIGGRPFALAPVKALSNGPGGLCPLGLASHHLPYHPRRLRAPVRRVPGSGRDGQARHETIAAETALAALAAAISACRGDDRGTVAVLDPRPGRSISALYRAFLAGIPGGAYLPVEVPESRAISAVRRQLEEPPEEIGIDLKKVSAVLSLGAPLLEGWGGPAVTSILARRRAAGGGGSILLQAEPLPSRTAMLADQWLRIRPGTETAFALGVANVLLARGGDGLAILRGCALDLDSASDGGFQNLAAAFTPERVAALTGLTPIEFVHAAAAFASRTPAGIALAGGDFCRAAGRDEETASAALTLLSGAVSRGGCFAPRRPLPLPGSLQDTPLAPARRLEELPDGSIRVLIVDGSSSGCAFPRNLLARKLRDRGALVVSFSPYLIGHAVDADFVVPSPAWLEATEEIPTPPLAACASFAVSPAILSPPSGCSDAAGFLRRLASATGIPLPGSGGEAALIAERAEAIQRAARGEIVQIADGSRSPAAAGGSAGALLKTLMEGGLWQDERLEWAAPPRFRLLGAAEGGPVGFASRASRGLECVAEDDEFPLILIPVGLSGLSGEGPVPPVLSKIYRESGLRDAPGRVFMNPETGRSLGLREGRRIVLESRSGRMDARASFDGMVGPGIVYAAAGPDPVQMGDPARRSSDLLALCEPDACGGRTVRARVVEV